MKKTLIALLFVAGTSALYAQDTKNNNNNTNTGNTSTGTTDVNSANTNNTNTTTTTTTNSPSSDMGTRTSTGDYNAYSTATNVPSKIQQSFTEAYPNATDAQWEQNNEWWRVWYKSNDQDIAMYYNMRGQSYMVALPVTQNQVPAEVVKMVKGKYGHSVYDITSIKGNNDKNVYKVRLTENGQIKEEWLGDDGNTIAATDVWATHTDEDANNAVNNNTGAGINNTNNNTGNNMNNTQSSGTGTLNNSTNTNTNNSTNLNNNSGTNTGTSTNANTNNAGTNTGTNTGSTVNQSTGNNSDMNTTNNTSSGNTTNNNSNTDPKNKKKDY
ncbi:MAG: hypothetical protein ICV65_05775 [Flavisolibacter sp.]|nr:hypothetical protein [Flavisolibacter sp.]MBD0350642.1 hypothetical protein [Flavisolibacter sp.]